MGLATCGGGAGAEAAAATYCADSKTARQSMSGYYQETGRVPIESGLQLSKRCKFGSDFDYTKLFIAPVTLVSEYISAIHPLNTQASSPTATTTTTTTTHHSRYKPPY